MTITQLTPNYDNAKSFYGKALVKQSNNVYTLQSYDTDVAIIEGDKLIINGEYSQTTMRHIRDFIYQYYTSAFDLSLKNIRNVISETN